MGEHKHVTSVTNVSSEHLASTKPFKKIPIYVVEEHNDALKFIYSAIGGKKLPVEGTTLLHLDAHPDMLISRQLQGSDARAGRKVLPLLEIENWILPAVAAGHLSRVVWLRPPWATQMSDGSRVISVGDDSETGLLRVNSKESYYLSDALFSSKLIKTREFTLTVAELGDPDCKRVNEEDNVKNMTNNLSIASPYVLDIDLDFFSTGNPFLSLYENIGLYDRLEPIFGFELPESDDLETIEKFVALRERQLIELENLFRFLEENGSLEKWEGVKSELFVKVSDIAKAVMSEADRLNESPDWWAVFAGGCTRDQGGLPYHISTYNQIQSLISRSLRSMLRLLPPPVLITIARSTDDGYCPPDQVDEIQSLVLHELKVAFDTADPDYYYLEDRS